MTGLARTRRQLAVWLFAVCFLIGAMVIIGGLTRLTGSGLSITQWKPIHGALPPLSQGEWNDEFQAYQKIPQYQQLNASMTLDEFKGIFWWEWSHRNLGRVIGMVFLLPFLWFLLKGQIERPLLPRLVMLFFLGGMQGVLGWYMVMSGLTDRVDVSQYRLVAHLGLALVIYAAMLWTALPLWRGLWPAAASSQKLFRWAVIVSVLVFVQILLGGFVAGLDAGLTYNTWPLMDGQFVPEGAFASTPVWLAPFEDVTTVQFNHRMMGYGVFISIVCLFIAGLRQNLGGAARYTSLLLVAAVSLQAALGVWTLLAVMPVWLAALHQFGAVVLLTAAVLHTDALRN